jgi:serine-type D-Ala-D-Ala carboxypeptidase/endopeptidase (penicillin-binding protein 4)
MKYNLLSFLLFILPFNNFSQSIDKAYALLESDQQLKYAVSSLTVVDASTGKTVFSKNGGVGLSPASTLKTVTSATAYSILGENYKWETTLSYSGTVSPEGVLQGDIVIKGYGDPSLGSNRYDKSKSAVGLTRWVNAIRQAGIKKVEGRIISDDSVFGTQTIPMGWIWQDLGNYYGAGSSSVCWGENQFDIIIKPGSKTGDSVSIVGTDPQIPYLKIVNEVTSGEPGTGDQVYAYCAPYSDVVYLRGTYALDLKKKVSASFPDPAYEAAFRLKQALESNGIAVKSEALTWRRLSLKHQSLGSEQKKLDTYESPTLAEICYWFNRKSINLYGENMLKTIAFATKEKATTEKGVAVLQDYWSRKLNLDKSSIAILDGSGLSPENKITTSAMVNILYSVSNEKWFNSYFNSFPEFNGIKMKSGTLRNVLAYAGYHQSKGGQKYVFSFIINNYNGGTNSVRQKMFKVLDELK